MWRAPAIVVTLTSQALLLSAVGLSTHLLHQLPADPAPDPVAETCPAVPECPVPDTDTEQAWRAMALSMLRDIDRLAPARFERHNEVLRYLGPGEDSSISAHLEEEGVLQLSTQAYLLHEAFVAEQLFASPDTLSRSVRVVPYYRDGVQQGFRLSAIRRGSLLYRIGLRNGDVLLRLNGELLTHPSQCFETLVRQPDVLTLELLRRSAPQMLVWEIVRPPAGYAP